MILFVYGTLQFPEILNALLGDVPKMSPVKLNGFAAVSLKDRMYPGLIKNKESTAEGFILDISNEQYDIIAAWEDEKYNKHYFEKNDVFINNNGYDEAVLTFLWTDKSLTLSDKWDRDKFYNNHLEEYLVRIKSFNK